MGPHERKTWAPTWGQGWAGAVPRGEQARGSLCRGQGDRRVSVKWPNSDPSPRVLLFGTQL